MEARLVTEGSRVDDVTGQRVFHAPRSWVEKSYLNLIYFNEGERAVTSPPGEEPALFSHETRAAFALLR
jgi:hypothetical protein